jgi:acetoacetyl-[acyl-carrier protein] synthase
VSRLPVIVGFGGINAAGRSSFHNGYRRLVLDALPEQARIATLGGLARLMRLGTEHSSHEQLVMEFGDYIRRHTLMRRIEPQYFNVDAIALHQRLHTHDGTLAFTLRKRELPHTLPPHWQVRELDNGEVEVHIRGQQDLLVETTHKAHVTSAGQLPSGFDPEQLYASRHHPRALQMTVFGASDALHSVGRDWEDIRTQIAPDRVAVYASSAHGQVDDYGTGGLFKFPWQGKRTSSKQCPLGFAEMPADFINAYVLGSVGRTAGILGACATFLYNLERAVQDIQSGKVDFALVGAAEAPIVPELMEGYRAMGALGEDAALLALDRAKGLTSVDNTRATRPFGYNAGFTIAESAQFLVLTSDALALELGLDIHGAVPGVFVHADGHKKSISAPGIGNYLTLGKAASLAGKLLGEQALKTQTCIQAHGTGTPQNRVTESHVFDTVAGAFGIDNWLVSSIKCYVGHSLGAAAGDQFMAALGIWHDGWIPGIFTLDEIASDVHRQHLRFSQAHVEEGRHMAASFINSKGFGGNNATALLLSPDSTLGLLRQRHGEAALAQWQLRREPVREQAEAYNQAAAAGNFALRYKFGEGVVDGSALEITAATLRIPGHAQAVSLDVENPYPDYATPPQKS